MADIITDNKEFIQKFGFDLEPFTQDKLDFRMDLLTEEFIETHTAYMQKNAEELVDGLIDLIVIAVGTLHLAGVDPQTAWDEVHRANMTKERGIKPGREQSKGFDVIKPAGWVGPSHVGNHGVLKDVFEF